MTDPISDIVDLQPGERVGVEPQRARALAGDEALIECDNLVKIYKVADLEVVALQGLDLRRRARRVRRHRRRVGQRQEHAAQHPRRARRAVAPAAPSSPATTSARWTPTRAHRLPAPRGRLRLAADGAQPAALPDRARERRAADAARRRGRQRRASARHAAARAGGPGRPRATIGRTASPAASSSASRSRWRSPTSPRSSSPTSRPASSTRTPRTRSSTLLRAVNAELGVTIVVVTHDPLVSEQVSRTVAIRDGRTSTETLRRPRVGRAGEHHVIAEEYAVLDRVGRLQLPRALRRGAGPARRVRLAWRTTTSTSGPTATATMASKVRRMSDVCDASEHAPPGDAMTG